MYFIDIFLHFIKFESEGYIEIECKKTEMASEDCYVKHVFSWDPQVGDIYMIDSAYFIVYNDEVYQINYSYIPERFQYRCEDRLSFDYIGKSYYINYEDIYWSSIIHVLGKEQARLLRGEKLYNTIADARSAYLELAVYAPMHAQLLLEAEEVMKQEDHINRVRLEVQAMREKSGTTYKSELVSIPSKLNEMASEIAELRAMIEVLQKENRKLRRAVDSILNM
jgi:hypothetical protein